MPLPVENLTEDSTPEAIKVAKAKSFEICMSEGGRTQRECAGMIYGIIEEKTGKKG